VILSKDLIQTVLSGILGLGWLTTLVTLLKDRAEQHQKIMVFLMERRQSLDNNTDLLAVVDFLKRELDAKKRHQSPPDFPVGSDDKKMDGKKLRNLPAFLEPIGTYLEYNPATFKKAYGVFADEVMLCANSELLWADEDARYDQSVYWKSFSRFVDRTKSRSAAQKS
jgi:hypothetical protein